jgi:hypothetical protein
MSVRQNEMLTCSELSGLSHEHFSTNLAAYRGNKYFLEVHILCQSCSFLSALYDKLRGALLARIIGPQLVEELPVLYENRGFVAVFSTAPH